MTEAKDKPIKKSRADGQISQLAGEFFVAAELLKRGLQASLTLRTRKPSMCSLAVMLRHRTRSYPGLRTYVFSRTLRAADYPEVTVLGDDGLAKVAELRDAGGKDIWLCGGGDLFRSLLDASLVDTIELGVSPIVLGQGRPFLPSPARSHHLRLTHQESFPSGLLVLHYDVERAL